MIHADAQTTPGHRSHPLLEERGFMGILKVFGEFIKK